MRAGAPGESALFYTKRVPQKDVQRVYTCMIADTSFGIMGKTQQIMFHRVYNHMPNVAEKR